MAQPLKQWNVKGYRGSIVKKKQQECLKSISQNFLRNKVNITVKGV